MQVPVLTSAIDFSLKLLYGKAKRKFGETQVLTSLEERILRFIGDYLRENGGESPTLAEIGEGCRIKSVGTIHRYVASIEKKGYLEKARAGWRTIVAPTALPYRGRIVAGQPLEAIEQQESIDLMDLLIQPDCFLLHVQGESMVDYGILDGDLIVARRAETARDGDIIVALVEGSDASLKEFRNRGNGQVELVPHNKEMPVMVYDAEQVQIQGILRSVIRMYEK
jgi:repressor LexA